MSAREDIGILLGQIDKHLVILAETIFFRISQHFENNLSGEKWHKELLDRMAIEVEKICPRVISDSVYMELAEIMRFCHFKRYYMDFRMIGSASIYLSPD